jgi:hypothetical protein
METWKDENLLDYYLVIVMENKLVFYLVWNFSGSAKETGMGKLLLDSLLEYVKEFDLVWKCLENVMETWKDENLLDYYLVIVMMVISWEYS